MDIFADVEWTCGKCGAKGKGKLEYACGWWVRCECGFLVAKGAACEDCGEVPRQMTGSATKTEAGL